MAYVSQELKSKLSPTIKAICKKYKVKASVAVRHHSTLVLNVKSGKIDFIETTSKLMLTRLRLTRCLQTPLLIFAKIKAWM